MKHYLLFILLAWIGNAYAINDSTLQHYHEELMQITGWSDTNVLSTPDTIPVTSNALQQLTLKMQHMFAIGQQAEGLEELEAVYAHSNLAAPIIPSLSLDQAGWDTLVHPFLTIAVENCYQLWQFSGNERYVVHALQLSALHKLNRGAIVPNKPLPYASNTFPSLTAINTSLQQFTPTALIDYMLFDTTIYCVVIANEVAIYRISNTPSLSLAINSFNDLVVDKHLPAKEFSTSAHLLYQQLVAPAISRLDNNIRALAFVQNSIVPLPMECLLTGVSSEVSYDQLPYLVNDYSIFYPVSVYLSANDTVPYTTDRLFQLTTPHESVIAVFEQQLRNGKTRARALQLAKIEYLKQVNTPDQAHPSQWAGVLLYDADALETFNEKSNFWVWAMAGLILVSFFYYTVKHKSWKAPFQDDEQASSS